MNQREVQLGSMNLTVDGDKLEVGDKAPDFKALDNNLTPYEFLKSEDGKVKILSAVPSLDTSVCELQTYLLFKAAQDFKDDITVITVSNDLPFAQSRFSKDKEIDNIKFVSDYVDHEFAKNYNALIKELMLLNRSIFVIDRENVVRYSEYLVQNTELPDIEKAVEVAKSLIEE